MIDTLSRGFDAFSGGLRQIAAGYDRTILFTTGSLDAGCDIDPQLSRSWAVLLTTRPTTMRQRHRQHDDRRCRRVDGIDQIVFELELIPR
ncbi:hypothetical protein I5U43_18905 [Stenotrophomonas maltophilia]|nr:hypothetical protein [Stenotrophomonas maltophilia]